MKRFKSLILAFIAILTIAITSIGANAAPELCHELALVSSNFGKKVQNYSSEWTATSYDETWDIVNFNNNNLEWDYIRCGTKNGDSIAKITNQTPFEEKIFSVQISIDNITAKNVNSIELLISPTTNFSYSKSYSFKLEAGDQKVDIPQNEAIEYGYYQIVFTCTKASNNGVVQISNVKYYTNSELASLPKVDTPTNASMSERTVSFDSVECEGYSIGLFTDSNDLDSLAKSYVTTETEYVIGYAPLGTYYIRVKALGDNATNIDSDYTDVLGTLEINEIYPLTISQGTTIEPDEKAPFIYYYITGYVDSLVDNGTASFYLRDSGENKIYVENLLADSESIERTSCEALGIGIGDLIQIVAYKTYGEPENKFCGYLSQIITKNYTGNFTNNDTKASLDINYKCTYDDTIQEGFEKVTDSSELHDGDQVVLVCEECNKIAMGINGTDTFLSCSDCNLDSIESQKNKVVFTINQTTNGWTFTTIDGNKLSTTGVKKIYWDKTDCYWNISFDKDGNVQICSTNNVGTMKYNSSDPRFTTYSSGQKNIQLYKKSEPEYSYTINTISMRFGTTISKCCLSN